MATVGIDEAGRGPVLGPLVVGIVRWESKWDPENPPLRDSKRLSSSQRQELYQYICDRADYRIQVIPAWLLTKSPDSLPWLEARVIVDVLRTFSQSPLISDRLSAGETIHEWITDQVPAVDCRFETKADDRYSAVSAASILAKVTRDQIIEERKKEWGELGSGYPSDPTTQTWLKEWVKTDTTWPSFVRTEWSTVKNLEKKENQLRLKGCS